IEDDTKRNRITGLFHSMNAVAIMLAPPLGALIADELGYTEVFMVSLVMMLVLLIFLFFYDLFKFNDHYHHREHGELIYRDLNPFAQVKDFLENKQLRTSAIIGMLASFTLPFISLVLPFILIEQMGLSNFHLGVMLFVFGLVHSFQYFFGIISDKIGERKSILFGVSTLVLTFFLFFLTDNYFLMLAIMLVRSIGISLWNVAMWSYLSKIGEENNIEGKVIGGYIALSRIASTISFVVSGALLVAWGHFILLFYSLIILIGLFATYKSVGNRAVTL
ncbi:MAG: MFS transporter, partial [Nanoarchaeota archaeon]|nr:MFS transporter [Nanoarchaeota archaeon]